jgi:hypothetical protein
MDPLVFAVSPLTATMPPLAAARIWLAAAMASGQFFFGKQVSDYSLYGGAQ